VRHKPTISAHAGIAAIKHGRLERVKRVDAPVHVLQIQSATFPTPGHCQHAYRLVSSVPTLVTQGVFICPSEVSMPCQEIALAGIVSEVTILRIMELRPTVRWIVCVCKIWIATKSSYRFFAPGNWIGSTLDGRVCKQRTASMYSLRSCFDNEPLRRREGQQSIDNNNLLLSALRDR
jgi:hypothetical protein